MASDEHKQLANFVKEVHSSLRKASRTMGASKAWYEHCQNNEVLMAYAKSMETLATKHWEEKLSNEKSLSMSRIKWCSELSVDYFINMSFIKFRQKEVNIGYKINITIENSNLKSFSKPLNVIDVGSCYNPFKMFDFMNVLAIDLCPANESVLQCDFLDVPIGLETIIEAKKIKQIKFDSFDVVTFCFLLEYIPTSELRIKACEKAYSILKPEGLLFITTPDSKHVGANCKLMKCWRYTLAHMGFTRIKYEKLKYMHCMAFRKCLNKAIAVRWADLHKEPYMDYNIHIPQDFQSECEESNISTEVDIQRTIVDFQELPYCDSEDSGYFLA